MSQATEKKVTQADPKILYDTYGLRRMSHEASDVMDDAFQTFNREPSERLRGQSQREKAVIEALLRPVLDHQMPAAGTKPADVLREHLGRLGTEANTRLDRPNSPLAKASIMRNADGSAGIAFASDAQLQVLGPPYVDQWTSRSSTGNTESTVWAEPANGAFGFTHGAAGGPVSSGAALWAQFIPDGPLPRAIEIRPYAPYDYQWDDLSDNGYVAHNDAGFGIMVMSWNFDGSDGRTEQDYRYSLWSDGTGWYEEHHNPSWGDSDSDVPFLFGHEAPYFTAQPGRVYRAATWCFGSCDADSGFFGNALTAASVRSVVSFLVVGENA